MTTNQKPPARPPTKSVPGSDAAPAAAATHAVPPEPDASRFSPAMQYGFEAYRYMDSRDYHDVYIPARHACGLINSVMRRRDRYGPDCGPPIGLG